MASRTDPPDDEAGARFDARVGVGLLVLAACVVVAMVAGGARLVWPPMDLSGAATWTIRIAGAAIAAGGLWALLAQRQRLAPATAGGADPSRAGLTTAGMIMGIVGLIALVTHPLGPIAQRDDVPYLERPTTVPGDDTVPSPPPPPQLGLGLVRAGEDRLAEPESPQVAEVEGISNEMRERIAAVVRWALIVVLALGGLWFLGRRLRGLWRREPETPVSAEEAEAGLEASLGAFSINGEEPREQIAAAYRRLLRVLDAAGAPREAHEAPHEHLDRALGPLGIPAEALHELAGLYVLAFYGERPVTERDRDAAIQALEASLGHLRTFVRRERAGRASGEPVHSASTGTPS